MAQLIALVLSEHAEHSPTAGLILEGVRHWIRASKFPFWSQGMRLYFFLAEVEATSARIAFVERETKSVINEHLFSLGPFQDRNLALAHGIIHIPPLLFPHPGKYDITLEVDGLELGRHPLELSRGEDHPKGH